MTHKKKNLMFLFLLAIMQCYVSFHETIRLVRDKWHVTWGGTNVWFAFKLSTLTFAAPSPSPSSFFPRLSLLQWTRYVRLEYKTKGRKQRTTSSNRIRLRLFIQIYTISIRNIRAIEQQFSSLLLSSLSSHLWLTNVTISPFCPIPTCENCNNYEHPVFPGSHHQRPIVEEQTKEEKRLDEKKDGGNLTNEINN